MKKRFFNMIEVLLALAISAIGITGIMGIIPLGLKANRDAMAETFAADIASSYFAQLSIDLANSATFYDFVKNKIPFVTPTEDDKDSLTFKDASGNNKTIYFYKNPKQPNPEDWKDGGVIKFEHKFNEDGVDFDDSKFGTLGYFRVFVGKKNGTEKVVPDFVADLCGWKYYPDDIADVENKDEAGKRNVARVCLEVSWPINAPYANREKRTFVRDFYDVRVASPELEVAP